MKHVLWPALILALALSGCSRGKRLWAKSVLGQPAPALIVEKWLTPQPETKGKFVLIDFWATWCEPCREAIKELNRFHAKYGDKLVVIGLSDESEEAVQRLQDPVLQYASAIDTQGRTKGRLEVQGIPHVIVIDPDGIVRWEGFPLQAGYRLTEGVLDDLFAAYAKPK